jgi:uncharacterized membrane protein
VSNHMSDRYVQYTIFVTIIEFCVIYVIWTLSVCVQQSGTGRFVLTMVVKPGYGKVPLIATFFECVAEVQWGAGSRSN